MVTVISIGAMTGVLIVLGIFVLAGLAIFAFRLVSDPVGTIVSVLRGFFFLIGVGGFLGRMWHFDSTVTTTLMVVGFGLLGVSFVIPSVIRLAMCLGVGSRRDSFRVR